MDATKIYDGVVTAIGIAAAATADGGSYTDLGAVDQENPLLVEWVPNEIGLSDQNQVPVGGIGTVTFNLLETDPSGIQATLETYQTTLGKLKITTVDSTNGYHFIDNIYLRHKQVRSGKPGEAHRFECIASRATDQSDDFCSGPKAAS